MIFLEHIEENTWTIVNEKKEVVNTITKDTVINYCKKELEENDIEDLNHNIIIDGVWLEIIDDYDLDLIENDYEYWDKLLAWVEYVCVEYFSNKIIAFYKQRLLKTK